MKEAINENGDQHIGIHIVILEPHVICLAAI
jgi:hypothetical protein